MSENNVAQVQQAQDAWTKMMAEHTARMEGAAAEAARLEAMASEHAKTAITEMAKLSTDTLAYYGQLTAEWRKLSLEATRRMTGLVSGKG